MTSKWEEYQCEARILAIFRERGNEPVGHHFGRPYLTIYQVTIEFSQRHPEVAPALNLGVGGVGTGENHSLTQYLGQQLSRRIHTGEITTIEGALLSDTDLEHISFRNGNETIESSLIGTYPVSIYRAVDHAEA